MSFLFTSNSTFFLRDERARGHHLSAAGRRQRQHPQRPPHLPSLQRHLRFFDLLHCLAPRAAVRKEGSDKYRRGFSVLFVVASSALYIENKSWLLRGHAGRLPDKKMRQCNAVRHQACCCTASITEDSSRRSEHLKDATRLLPRAQWVACSQAPLMAEREGLMSCARHRIHLCHAAPTFLPTRWRLAPPWQRSARARRRQPVGRFLREMRPPSMRAIAGRRLVRRSGRAETAMGAQGGTRGPSWQAQFLHSPLPVRGLSFTCCRASLTNPFKLLWRPDADDARSSPWLCSWK